VSEDPWGGLDRRYSNNERDQFVLFVEQFAAAAEMIRDGGLTGLRIALVAVDNLAEVLLHRQKEKVFRIGAQDWRHDVPRYDRDGRRRLGNDFNARVQLAGKGTEDIIVKRVFRPLLDEGGQAIFRTAHAYRNRVYHADHHNPAVLPLITAAYLIAVGDAFVRYQPTGIAGTPDASVKRLTKYGLDGGEGEDWPEMFAPAEAARTVIDHLGAGLAPDLAATRVELSEDLVARVEWADAMVAELDREGLDREQVEWGMRWGAYWEEVLEKDPGFEALDIEFVELSRRVESECDRGDEWPATQKRLESVAERRSKIAFGGFREYETGFGLGEIEAIRAAAARIARSKTVPSLFDRYWALDQRIERVERALDEAATGWDRHLQAEEDRARGN
jgi:hypothetical protein